MSPCSIHPWFRSHSIRIPITRPSYCQNGNIFISRGPTRRRRSMTGIDSSKSRTSRVCRSNSGQVRPLSQGGDVWSKLRNVCTFWGYVRALSKRHPAGSASGLGRFVLGKWKTKTATWCGIDMAALWLSLREDWRWSFRECFNKVLWGSFSQLSLAS